MTVMSITCGCVRSQKPTKLLKIPRVYNALITSDETLLPSQAYPAISPVIQGVQYPAFPVTGLTATGFFAPGPYQALYSNNQIPNGAVLLDNSGSFTYSVRRENTLPRYKYDPPSLSISRSEYLAKEDKSIQLIAQQLASVSANRDQAVSLFDPVSRSNAHGIKLSSSHSYPIGGNLAKVVSVDDFNNSTSNINRASGEDLPPSVQDTTDKVNTGDFVKNNRPSDPSIVDVPPPPLPIGQRKSTNEKVRQEYPPPPGGFIV